MPQMMQSRGFQGQQRQTQEAQEPMGGGFLGRLLQTAIPISMGMLLGSSMGPGGSLMGALGGIIGESAGMSGIDQFGGGQAAQYAQPANIQAGGMLQAQGPPQQPQQPQAQAQQIGQEPEEEVHDPMVLASSLLEGWAGAGTRGA